MKSHGCSGRSGRKAVEKGVKGSLSCRSVEVRASRAVGLRWQAVLLCSDRLDLIDSTSWGARRGAGWQAQMAEDLDDHRRIFDPCPEQCVEGAAMIFKAPPQFGQCSTSISKTRLSSGPSSCAAVGPVRESPRLRSR